MAIHVVCGHCNNRCALPDSMRGKRVNCPACGHPLTIPGGVKGKATPPPSSRPVRSWIWRTAN